jgi:hypothetical protein
VRSSERHSRRAPWIAGAAALLIAVPQGRAAAQHGNQSDVTGIPITSSSVVSPVFGVSLGGAVRVITFITPQVAASYQQSAARVNAELGSQSFSDSGGMRPNPTTQNLIYEVASGGATSAQASARLVAILTRNNAAPATVANAEAFVESFRSLLAKGISMDPRFFNSVTATQLANAVAAYNAFIDSSTEQFLMSPPPELVTVHGVLAQLTSR